MVPFGFRTDSEVGLGDLTHSEKKEHLIWCSILLVCIIVIALI